MMIILKQKKKNDYYYEASHEEFLDYDLTDLKKSDWTRVQLSKKTILAITSNGIVYRANQKSPGAVKGAK